MDSVQRRQWSVEFLFAFLVFWNVFWYGQVYVKCCVISEWKRCSIYYTDFVSNEVELRYFILRLSKVKLQYVDILFIKLY